MSGSYPGTLLYHVGRHAPDPFRRRQHGAADIAFPLRFSVSMKARRSTVSATRAPQVSGLLKGGAARLTIRLVLTPVGRMVQIAFGGVALDDSSSSGTVTSVREGHVELAG